MCRDCRTVSRFTSVGGVLAALEICNSSVFAIFVGSAAAIGVASFLRIVVFWRMRLLSNCRIVCRSTSVLGVVTVS